MFRYAFCFLLLSLAFPILGFSQSVWTLEQCLNYATENNLDVRLAGVGVEQADVALQQRRLNRLPSVTGSAYYGLAFGRFTNPDNLTIDASRSQSNSFSVNGNLPIFQGFGLMRSIRAAEDQRGLAETDQKAAEDQVRINVLQAYLQVLLALEDERRREVQIEVSRDNLSNSARLAQAGVIPEGNLRELEAQVATDELGVIQAANNIALAYLQLRLVMQADEAVDFEVQVPDPASMDALLAVEDWDAAAIYRYAAGTLPAVTRNLMAEQLAKDNIDLARSDLYPSLGLTGGASTSWFTEKAVADFLPSYGDQLDNNFGQFVGLGLNVPIFTNGLVRANIRNAELLLDQQKISSERDLNTLRQTIEQSVADAKAAASSYQAAKKVVEARKLSLEFAQKRFEAGQAPSFELNNARNLLIAAEADLLTAKYNYLLASKVLEFYQGRPLNL
ncbi:MAG: hypothetical protein GC205_09120 [Bacteroidetes bacterium]|nr:hypothetical protein [Bacteroidota bacterium]